MVNAFDVLKERGFVQQVTHEDEIRKLFDAPPATVYVGYDPTAGRLHVGHLFTVMPLLHLERLGHRPVVVLGGGVMPWWRRFENTEPQSHRGRESSRPVVAPVVVAPPRLAATKVLRRAGGWMVSATRSERETTTTAGGACRRP